MVYYKLLVLQLLIGVTLCRQVLRLDKSLYDVESYSKRMHRVQPLKTITEQSAAIKQKEKIEIKLYYETLCPASVDFFVRQLKPVVTRLGSHLDIHLIPYGHATTRAYLGRYVFSCQHGIAECYGNTVHACAFDVLPNNTLAISFNSCLMEHTSYKTDYDYFVSTFNWCGYREGVQISEIWKCVNSRKGTLLLKGYGDETSQIELPYVPYIVIDGSSEHQDEAASNLFRTVCRMLVPRPPACYHT